MMHSIRRAVGKGGTYVVLFALLLGFSAPAADSGLASCLKLLEAATTAPESRTLESLEELRTGTFNTFNLYWHLGLYQRLNNGRLKELKPPVQKDPAKTEGLARAILEANLDVVCLQEVESATAARRFNQEHLAGQYNVFVARGNDPVGNRIVFLIRKNLPFTYEIRYNETETWRDPARRNREVPLFLRGLPVIIFRAPKTKKPLFIFMGIHFKSKKSREGDPGSRQWKEEEVARALVIYARLQQEFGKDTPIMILGDTNAVFETEPGFQGFRNARGLEDVFRLISRATSPEERATFTFHPRPDDSLAQQLDAALANPAFRQLIIDAYVQRFRDAEGRELPLPSSLNDRDGYPSDHMPLVVRIAFRRLYEQWLRENPQAHHE